MKFKCLKCKQDYERVTKQSQLAAIPEEWYNHKEVFENEVILYCKSCKLIKVLGAIDKMRWKIANKIMGQG